MPPGAGKIVFYLLVEAAVVITEGRIYRAYLQGSRHPMKYSLAANGCSFFLGLLIG